MLKRNRLVVRSIILITIFATACFLSIGLNLLINELPQQRITSTDFTGQKLSEIVIPQEIELNADSQVIGEISFKEVQESKSLGLNLEGSGNIDTEANLFEPTLKEQEIEQLVKEITEWEQKTETVPVPREFYSQIVKNVKPVGKDKVIALTFDDGPWPGTTSQVLEILKKEKIKATFFWVGQYLKIYPKIAQEVVAAGHTLGNHTWHHWYTLMNPSAAAREIDETATLIYKTTGIKTLLFRPPGGLLNNGVVDYAKQHNYVTVMWSADSMDYRVYTPDELVNHVIRKAQPGGIVLMHDGGGNRSATVEALPKIITKLKELGYKFVTIPKLLEMKEKQQLEVVQIARNN